MELPSPYLDATAKLRQGDTWVLLYPWHQRPDPRPDMERIDEGFAADSVESWFPIDDHHWYFTRDDLGRLFQETTSIRGDLYLRRTQDLRRWLARALDEGEVCAYRWDEPQIDLSGFGARPVVEAYVPQPLPAVDELPVRQLLSIEWDTAEARCSDRVSVSGLTKGYEDGDKVLVEFVSKDRSKTYEQHMVTVSANRFQVRCELERVYPGSGKLGLLAETPVLAVAKDKESPRPLIFKACPDADVRSVRTRWGDYEIRVVDFAVEVSVPVRYVKGWPGQAVRLDGAVPAVTGGVVHFSRLPASYVGYRYMKYNRQNFPIFHDGSDWVPVPKSFKINDSNTIPVNVYQDFEQYPTTYGSLWPDPMPPWTETEARIEARIKEWKDDVSGIWSKKIGIRRKQCSGSAPSCCRYDIEVFVLFQKSQYDALRHVVLLACGTGRDNSGLFFMDSPSETIAHEVGHLIDNPDEYPDARSLDPTLNEDGARNGIDDDSIMGSGMRDVKKRHLRHVCSTVSDAIKAKYPDVADGLEVFSNK